MDNQACRNCGEENTNNFCASCGEQQYKRIVMKAIADDFLSNLISLEGPILQTIKDLTIRPGKMINDYLSGKRIEYYKPFQYYLLAVTAYFFFFFLWGNEMTALISDGPVEGANTITIGNLKFQSENQRFFTFLQIPIYSWLIWLFFRKKSGHTYTETLVSSLYIMAQVLLFGIIFTFCEFIKTGSSSIVGSLFLLIYLPWVLKKLYNEPTFKTILKSTAIIVLVTILYGILMIIISLVWIIFFG